MIEPFELFVPGVPKPQGSKKAFAFRRKSGGLGASMVESSKGLKPWRLKVQLAARSAWSRPLLTGPMRMDLVFIMPRPKSHYRTGRFSRMLKPSAPRWHSSTPDRDKLMRAVGDALTGEVYADDCLHCAGEILKEYGENPGVQIRIWPLNEADKLLPDAA